MKKQLLTLLLILVTISPLVAQQHYIGVKDAYNISGLTSLMKTSTISSVFNPGIVYRYEHKQFGKFKFGFQAEINLVNKGFLIDADTARNTPDIKHTIQSIDIPFMAQGIFILGPLRPYIMGGVNVGYILSRKVETLGVKEDFVFSDVDRRTEYGIGGGAGVGLDLKRFLINAEWRYSYNFSFLQRPFTAGQLGSDFKNTTQMFISLSLLYKLSKDKKQQ